MANSAWHDNPKVQKGEYGEYLVSRYLENQGCVMYAPVTDKAHGFDLIAYRNGRYFAVEVKTKTMLRKYPETGFSEFLFQRYQRLCNETNLPLLVAFVDEGLGAMYGNYLHELNKPVFYHGSYYPKVIPHKNSEETRYFPKCHMRLFRNLTPHEINFLKSKTEQIVRSTA